MTKHLLGHGRNITPQSQPIPGSGQVENSAGGFAWDGEPLMRARRFLILGSEGGSYYASQQDLTRENIAGLRECLRTNGPSLVHEIVSISESGRAAKNDYAIFALALCASEGDDVTRRLANTAMPLVCRTATHLFQWAAYIDDLSGWGRGKRAAVRAWYEGKDPQELAYQLVKYRQRDGWTHRDVLRLAHVPGHTPMHKRLLAWAAGNDSEAMLGYVSAFEQLQRADTPTDTVRILQAYADDGLNVPRECIRTEHLTDARVWQQLVANGMPMTALIRNLPTMTRVGLLTPMSAMSGHVAAQLTDQAKLTSARIHPVKLLAALVTYQEGRSLRGSATWEPTREIVDALDASFYMAFGNVAASEKKTLLALDVSSSMASGSVSGVPGLTPRLASAAMALVTMNSEPTWMAVAFSHQLVPLNISPGQRLDDVVRTMSRLPFGRTDCALPMMEALAQRAEVESFVIYTDSETWFGNVHPMQALVQYRRSTGIYSSLTVVGMVGNRFSIADPTDERCLDVVGFDTAAPQLISDFAAGRI